MLKEQLERTFLIGIGLLSLTREKAQAVVEDMVKQGSAAREDVKELTEKLVERGEEERKAFREMTREEVNRALHEMNLATAEDVERLEAEVATLKAQLQTEIYKDEVKEESA